jgi:DNA polymerase-3 subunit gamma/tau
MSYRALYRKYRPRLFADIVGQPGIVRALSSQVEAGRISHAYLFSGPRGTGKTSAAKVLARAINCENNVHGDACGKCRPCVELLSETNMDIVEIDAASNNSVDRVREMIENVKYMPAVGRYRVYIVDEVHMLSTSAFNALLKTLEEPPAHVVFILATTEPHKLPATVLSRCQQFLFRRISVDDMVGLLEGVLKQEGASAEKEALQAIARASEGGMRDALSLMDQCLSLDEARVTKARVLDMLGTSDSAFFFSVAECLLSGDAGGAAGELENFIEAGGDIRTFASDLCRHLRDLFIASYVKDPGSMLDVTGEEAAQLKEQAARSAPGDVLKCLGIVTELEGSLRYAANPRVLMELALFRCCRTEKENSYDDLAARIERLEAKLAQGVPAPAPQARPAPLESKKPAPKEEPPREPPAAQAHPPIGEDVPPPEEDEAPPWDEPGAGGPAARTAQEEPPALFAEGWDEESQSPAPEDREPETTLPGQMDLFAGLGAEASSADIRGVAEKGATPPAEEGATPTKPPENEAKPPPGKIWKAALKELEKQSNIYSLAEKGRSPEYDGRTLTVSFNEDESMAAKMLEERMPKLNAAVDKAAGHHVEVRLKITQWSPSQQQFIEKSRGVIPKGTVIEIEKEE